MKDYSIERLLGNGTFGKVYLVRRKSDSKPFVLKEQYLNINNIASSKLVTGEIQCLRSMRHTNIIAYHDAWIENKVSYILMEYATRGTLKELLEKRQSPLKEQEALYIFSQIVLGVHHIHSKKILHRDLKPENIMLTGRRGDVVKIGDFGVSRSLREEVITCRAGSFYYMAPEMLTNHLYDLKCDIWSMGVVLYEMITKKLPFPATNMEDIITMACYKEAQPLPYGTSKNIVNLISKMLRKRAPFRPNTTQLLHCPFLVRSIILVHLNVGRIPNIAQRYPEAFGAQVFTKFLKSRNNSTVITG